MRPRAFALVSILFGSTSFLAAQGPLAPTGPPAATMKTLDQVEARIPIDAIHTPPSGPHQTDDDYTITAPGSYYLTGNITLTKYYGLEVDAVGVTIDLNGFQLIGPGAGLSVEYGVYLAPTARECVVKNGSITGCEFGIGSSVTTLPNGIRISNVTASDGYLGFIVLGDGATLSQCTALNNTNGGFSISGGGGVLRDCVARSNGVYGFIVQGSSSGCLLQGCSATSNNGAGFFVGQSGCTLLHCTASSNLGGSGVNFGFSSGVGSKLVDCTSFNNTGVGIAAGQGSSVTGCQVRNNTSDGIQIPNDCYVARNHCSANGSAATLGAGIHATSDGNRIVDNSMIFNNNTGLKVDGISNLITGNSSRFQTTKNFVFAAGNHYGAVVDLTATSTAAVGTNSAANTIANADGTANFAY